MKKLFFVAAAFVTALFIYSFVRGPQPAAPFNVAQYKRSSLLRCTPDWASVSALLDATEIMPMPGAGSYQWKITTTSDSAQFYFNQGINMYYGFHIIEAMASFKKASRFDAQSPMLWWAQALAYGPNINDVGYTASPEALDVTAKATALLEKATPVEKALINAMQLRYSNDTLQTRATLNQVYSNAMKAAFIQFPKNADVATLYADALMLQHPWSLWNNDGTPKLWTPEIEKVLEKTLALAPLHPGANHYYIHVMEPSPDAAKAMPSARRLGALTPGLAHMVHMPSHIYLRTGYFNDGVTANEKAVANFQKYNVLFPAVADGAFIYQLHNQHMQVNCALLAGRYETASRTAAQLQESIDTAMLSIPAPLGSAVQYGYMAATLADIRFEKWDRLLQASQPTANHVYASVLYHFGKGMAYAGTDNLEAAKQQAELLKPLLDHADLQIAITPYSAPVEGARCAAELLDGFIELKQQHFQTAIQHYTKAVAIEKAMIYNEPRDWLLNPNHYLGMAYLKAGQYNDAEKAFRTDLKINAANVWSLHGLAQALQKRGAVSEAARVKKELAKAATQSDVKFEALYF